MANNPAFAATPRAGVGVVSVANANRDGTGTLVSVLAAGAAGSKIEEVWVSAIATVTAGMVRLFVTDGATTWLFDEIAVTGATPGATVAAFRTLRRYDNLILPNGWTLRAATNNAETFNVLAFGGDF